MIETVLKRLSIVLSSAFHTAGMPRRFASWDDAIVSRVAEPRNFPVQTWLDVALADAPAQTQPVASALAVVTNALQWGQTYASGEFLDSYAWAELIGAKGPLASATCAVGIVLLGPKTFYPPHAHPACEYYLPISGAASWYNDLEGWRDLSPGTLVYHPSNVAHAMKTGDQPLLAAYCWGGNGLHTPASILPR